MLHLPKVLFFLSSLPAVIKIEKSNELIISIFLKVKSIQPAFNWNCQTVSLDEWVGLLQHKLTYNRGALLVEMQGRGEGFGWGLMELLQ